MWEDFVQPVDQTVLQGVDRKVQRCARDFAEKVRVVEEAKAASQATTTAHETWPVRMKMSFFLK